MSINGSAVPCGLGTFIEATMAFSFFWSGSGGVYGPDDSFSIDSSDPSADASYTTENPVEATTAPDIASYGGLW